MKELEIGFYLGYSAALACGTAFSSIAGSKTGRDG